MASGHVREPRPGGDVGEVGHPEPVRGRSPELPVHLVARAWRGLVADRGAYGLAAHGALEAHLPHQARHRATGDIDPFAVQLPPDLPHAVDPEVLVPDAADVRLQHRVAPDPRRRRRGIGPARRMGVTGRRGDRQDPADRLDPVHPAMIVDERDHGLNRRSSSAWAKYALALRRISLAWRNSRFSRSSAFSRSRSSVVSPGRAPRSRSDRLTHSRSVSALQPTFSAIERIAAHCEPCSASCSRTSRTARSRSSTGYGFVGFLVSMDPILPKVGASGKPGAVPLSPTKARGAPSGPASIRVANIGASEASPPVSSKAMGRPSWSVFRWIFVPNPPRERPSA